MPTSNVWLPLVHVNDAREALEAGLDRVAEALPPHESAVWAQLARIEDGVVALDGCADETHWAGKLCVLVAIQAAIELRFNPERAFFLLDAHLDFVNGEGLTFAPVRGDARVQSQLDELYAAVPVTPKPPSRMGAWSDRYFALQSILRPRHTQNGRARVNYARDYQELGRLARFVFNGVYTPGLVDSSTYARVRSRAPWALCHHGLKRDALRRRIAERMRATVSPINDAESRRANWFVSPYLAVHGKGLARQTDQNARIDRAAGAVINWLTDGDDAGFVSVAGAALDCVGSRRRHGESESSARQVWKTDLAPALHGPAPRLSLTVTYTLARPRRGDQPGQRFDVETVSPPIEVELPPISFDIAQPKRPSASSFTPWNLVP